MRARKKFQVTGEGTSALSLWTETVCQRVSFAGT